MFEFDKICRDVERLDPETYAEIIATKSVDIIAGITAISEDPETALSIYLGLILGSIISDGKITEEEFLIVKPLLSVALGREVEYNATEINTLLRYFKAETKEYKKFIDAIVDLLGEVSDELKTDIVTVCLLICGIDGKISLKEKAWLKKLIK